MDKRDGGTSGSGAGAPADPEPPGGRPTVSVDVLQALVDFLDDVVERPAGAGNDAGARAGATDGAGSDGHTSAGAGARVDGDDE